MENFKLGEKVKDKVTGIIGIITGRCEYLNGCIQYGVTPKAGKDSKYPDVSWIDEKQLESNGVGISIKRVRTGGPQRHP